MRGSAPGLGRGASRALSANAGESTRGWFRVPANLADNGACGHAHAAAARGHHQRLSRRSVHLCHCAAQQRGCAFGALRALRPDVAVLDAESLRDHGIDLMRRISRTRIGTRVVFISCTSTPSAVHKKIASGVSGYAGRHATEAELRSTVVAVANGQTVVAEPLRRALLREIAALENPEVKRLSGREAQTLQLVADGYPTHKVAKELLVSEATVKTYLRRVYTKLAVTSQAAAVAVALRHRLID